MIVTIVDFYAATDRADMHIIYHPDLHKGWPVLFGF